MMFDQHAENSIRQRFLFRLSNVQHHIHCNTGSMPVSRNRKPGRSGLDGRKDTVEHALELGNRRAFNATRHPRLLVLNRQ
jgi:hypothetical protein